MIEKIGLDIGGVIIDPSGDGGDTSFFSDRYLETPEAPGALAALFEIARVFGPTNVHFVSKCGKNTERKTREWLKHHDVHDFINPVENVHFCRERHEKAPICERLGITHFVDDRWSVLKHMVSVKNRILFNPKLDELTAYQDSVQRGGISVVYSWGEVRKYL